MNVYALTADVETQKNHCRMCRKKLWLLKRLLDAEFCGGSHRAAYARKQIEMGLARLYEAASQYPLSTNPGLPHDRTNGRPEKHTNAAA